VDSPYSRFSSSRSQTFLSVFIIIGSLFATYSTSFHGPFIFDDNSSIIDNTSLKHLSQIFSLHGGTGFTVSGRPILNASLALNYALGGYAVFGFHVLNFIIHCAASVTLFGLLRRTLKRIMKEGLSPYEVSTLSLLITLLWALHPLQTESVTYVIQRAESLMGFFYLFSIYGFIRSIDEANEKASRTWAILSVVSVFLGMGSKEVMVSAPFFILLYDRTLITGTFLQALKKRKLYYTFLALSLVIVCLIALNTGTRNDTAGFGLQVSPLQYWQTQFQAITHYLFLSVWPKDLIFDYGVVWTRGLSEYWYHALIVIALLSLTGWAMIQKKAYALLGAFFFGVLAPTSIVPGVRQTMAEHRMYLPLASVITALVLIGFLQLKKKGLFKVGLITCLSFSCVLAYLTLSRNAVYQNPLTLYRDTATKRPENAFAHYNLANQILLKGKTKTENVNQDELEEASREYAACIQYAPNYADAYFNWGNTLHLLGKTRDAIEKYDHAVAYNPKHAEAEAALAAELGKIPGAEKLALMHLERSVTLNAENYDSQDNLGIALSQIPTRIAEAEAHFLKAIALNPKDAKVHNDLGLMLSQIDTRKADAISEYLKAINLNPTLTEAHVNIAFLLSEFPDKRDAAISQYEEALKLDPNQALAHNNVANLFASIPEKQAEAIIHYQAALRLKPNYAEAHNNLANVLNKIPEQVYEAIRHYRAAIFAQPDYVEAHYNLAATLGNQGRLNEAAEQFKLALKYNPHFQPAIDALNLINAQGR
jgi:tetratricopeptide (TPR) repeat protein